MKLKTTYPLAVLALVMAGGFAPGQTQVPGPTDYNGFSRFIANRNIFDPARYPRSTGRIRTIYRPRPGRSAPGFSFVGCMIYGKGLFAFFDGNNDDYRKALQVSGKIAGYTVQEISLDGVKLEVDGKTIFLPVGTQMHLASDGTWVQARPDEAEDFSNRTESSAPAPAAAQSIDNTAAPSGSTGEMSDVLKRLMKLREQENK